MDDYYINKFRKQEENFHETLEKFPIFIEDILKIEENDLKEINDLLEKNNDFYLKKAISKMDDLINYIKNRNIRINKEYQEFDKLTNIWNKLEIKSKDDKYINNLNYRIQEANMLIKSHDLNDLISANKIMQDVLKEVKK